MSQIYICDVCAEAVSSKDGKLHCIEATECNHGEMHGFSFWDWHDEAARDPEYGHVHIVCIPMMLNRYLVKFKWGRIVTGRRSIHVSKEKLANRKKKANNLTVQYPEHK